MTYDDYVFSISSIIPATLLTKLTDILKLTETNSRDIVIIMGFEFVYIMMFLGLSLVEFITRNNANRIDHKEDLENKSLVWSTLWKSFGLIMLTFLFVFVSIMSILIDSRMVFLGSVWFITLFWVMACGFEFHSIGLNLARMNGGKTHPVFGLTERLLNVVERSVSKRLQKGIGGDIEPESENNDNQKVEENEQVH